MNVKGIFVTLITIVACVILGAFVLNVLMPNVTTTLISSAEDMIFNASGLAFDFNADGHAGTAGKNTQTGANTDTTVTGDVTDHVEGFGE